MGRTGGHRNKRTTSNILHFSGGGERKKITTGHEVAPITSKWTGRAIHFRTEEIL